MESDEDAAGPPGWAFSVTEVSAGVYRVIGTDRDGRSVERTGSLDEALADARRAARRLDAAAPRTRGQDPQFSAD